MKINYRQTCILVMFSQIALKFLALPSLMYIDSGKESVFVALALMIVDALFAFMLLGLAQKSGEKNVYDFMCSCLGKVLTKILLMVLLAKYLLVIANLTKGLEFFVVDNLYNEFKWYYYVLPLIAVVGYMTYKGINNIARVSEIVCWLVLVGVIYITIKSCASADVESFLPLFKHGVNPLFKSAYRHTNWFGSSTFLLLLFGKIDFREKRVWQMIKYIFVAIALVMFVYVVFYGIFQITSPSHNFCISDISEFTSIHSATDELSWLVVSLWIVAEAVQIALYSYCVQQCLKFVFNLNNNVVSTLIIMVYILLLSLVGEQTIGSEQIFLTNIACIISVVAQYVVPLIIAFAALVGGKLKNKKQKANNVKTKYAKNKKVVGNEKT